MMLMRRRDFISGLICTGTMAAAGCAMSPKPSVFVANGEIRALLLHLGHNMWNDYLPDDMDNAILRDVSRSYEDGAVDTELRNKEVFWNRVVNRMVERRLNMLVIDLGEGLEYPSHPELAIRGSWSPERMRREIARLNALGIEVIPKLNFSTSHNGWMKHYRRMVSRSEERRVGKECYS